MRSREAFRNHDSLEAVTKQKQGALLLMFFFGSRQAVCDLNVVTLRSLIAHKINLKPVTGVLAFLVALGLLDKPDIDVVTAHYQFVENNIF